MYKTLYIIYVTITCIFGCCLLIFYINKNNNVTNLS
ncbi:hypothetical protein CoNPh11_CDS0050 [Staphylococcus phage S-CoN_Ph11]|nr:hypothetical protein BE22_0036 [Staphylococcus phage vB_SepS_BE22]WNM51536.1 hypothetical protein CoNPh1_CDS0138 [Staphylococcus phage S-CoN_Ph1]WNM51577.1 hypothetical protein CoNPh2_CDS0022 [Staphylococcus phage S-CoN_Ph2]WNM51738.1 hypothetical protein CoNPh3_CDS0023 [Staphylococcus phage S-CoN_Ph3]WNM52025.1 hypothetical protein CoNPh4_CDS0150 [Staphylococcus phage S-CoN_Ph4]WNM52202.1 hypothetical protein CoNPh5_CDS0157 [Staphylococcus phage S-CoN_Ph5]WNM52233.1 hypothetical protein C